MPNLITILIFRLSHQMKCQNAFENTLLPLPNRAQCKIMCTLCVHSRFQRCVSVPKFYYRAYGSTWAEFFKNSFEYYSKNNPWINMKFGTCPFCTFLSESEKIRSFEEVVYKIEKSSGHPTPNARISNTERYVYCCAYYVIYGAPSVTLVIPYKITSFCHRIHSKSSFVTKITVK